MTEVLEVTAATTGHSPAWKLYVQKKLANGKCVIKGCEEPRLEGRQKCERHHARTKSWRHDRDQRRYEQGLCRDCNEQRLESNRHCAKHLRRVANANLKAYGIDGPAYDAMLAAQGGVCAICEKPSKARRNRGHGVRRLSVDHDHATGQVRGLLCHECNVTVGYLERNRALLDRMSKYIAEGGK